jgi:hypothetical protein
MLGTADFASSFHPGCAKQSRQYTCSATAAAAAAVQLAIKHTMTGSMVLLHPQ